MSGKTSPMDFPDDSELRFTMVDRRYIGRFVLNSVFVPMIGLLALSIFCTIYAIIYYRVQYPAFYANRLIAAYSFSSVAVAILASTLIALKVLSNKGYF